MPLSIFYSLSERLALVMEHTSFFASANLLGFFFFRFCFERG